MNHETKLESWEENRAALAVALGGTDQDVILDVLHAVADDAGYKIGSAKEAARASYILGYLTSFIAGENADANAADRQRELDEKLAKLDALAATRHIIRAQAE